MTDAPKGSNADELSALTPSTPAPVVPKVKPLVWEYHWAGKLASNNMGRSYIIDTRGPRPKWMKWPGPYGTECETVEEMQAAAQADHEARVLSQLDMAPVTVHEAARVLLGAAPNPIFDDLKARLVGEFHEPYTAIDEEGDEVNFLMSVSWTTTKEIITAALRALAEQEGE